MSQETICKDRAPEAMGAEHHDSDPLAPTRGIVNAIIISLAIYGMIFFIGCRL